MSFLERPTIIHETMDGLNTGVHRLTDGLLTTLLSSRGVVRGGGEGNGGGGSLVFDAKA